MSDALDVAFVEIRPRFDRFNREVRRGINVAARNIEQTMTQALNRVEKAFLDSGGQINRIAGASFDEVGKSAQRASQQAARAVSAATEDIKDSIETNIGDAADDARDSIDGIGDESRTTFEDIGDDVDDAADRVTESAERMERNGSRAFRRLRNSVDRLRTSLGNLSQSVFTLQGRFVALASLITVAVVAAIGAAEELGGILATLPALAAVAAAGIATLSVVTRGMGDAFEAAFGDAEEFAEATENLSPSARAVAQEFRDLVPLLRRIGLAVQEAAFAELQGDLTAIARNLAGPVQEGMSQAAATMGQLVSEAAAFGAQAETARTVGLSFQALDSILRGLRGAIQPFLEGLRILADEFLPVIIDAEAPIAAIGERFREWAEAVTESGEAMEQARRAVGFLGDTFGTVRRTGDILSASFDAATDAGINLIQTVNDLLDDVITLAETPTGQAGLQQFFLSIDRILRSLLPIFGAAAVQVGRLVTPLADLIEELGPGAKAALEGIADGLIALVDSGGDAFASALSDALIILAPHLETVGAGIGRLLDAVSPLLEPLSRLIGFLLELGGGVLQAVSPFIEILAAFLSEVLTPIFGVFLRVAEEALPPLADAFQRVTDKITPLLETMGGAFLAFLEETLPTTLLAVTAIIEGIVFLIDLWIQNWDLLTEAMSRVWEWIKDNIIPIIQDELMPVVREELIPAIDEARGAFGEFLDATRDLWNEILLLVAVIVDEADIEIGEFRLLILLVRGAVSNLTLMIRILAGAIRLFVEVNRPAITGLRAMADGANRVRSDLGRANGVFRTAWRRIKDIIDRGVRLVTVFNNIRSAALKVATAIANIPSVPSLGNLGDFFADGGIVRGFTRAVIGEAGPEVVIPLTRPQRARELVQQSGLLNVIGLENLTGFGSASRSASRTPESPSSSITVESGAVRIEFFGATPDEAQARRVGAAAGQGLMDTIAARNAALAIKRL